MGQRLGQINPDVLSAGEQVFLTRIKEKQERGEQLTLSERQFITDMEARSMNTIKVICNV
ncbi:hypothetical protein [uncultured Draconibacterium sp.]|uniref:hypothetical protein n=1 Tax=uncultured Draconibacterium sp. TaxID=1573823 RepID=UPI0029C98380|nr:hypothetical protein [uncultured Draconibacterium sp.]